MASGSSACTVNVQQNGVRLPAQADALTAYGVKVDHQNSYATDKEVLTAMTICAEVRMYGAVRPRPHTSSLPGTQLVLAVS